MASQLVVESYAGTFACEVIQYGDDGPKRNAKSIEEKNVRYVSDRDLVNDVNLRCKLTRAG